jgi:hypothetical protein
MKSKRDVSNQVISVPVKVTNQFGQETPGTATVILHSKSDAFWKGGKRSAKLIGIIMLALLPFGFLEPFFFMVWGSATFLLLVLLIGPYLHILFASETKSFVEVHAECLHCHAAQKALQPYVSTRFEVEFTVICPSCGQTSRVSQTTGLDRSP